jgi:hypothetical protein
MPKSIGPPSQRATAACVDGDVSFLVLSRARLRRAVVPAGSAVELSYECKEVMRGCVDMTGELGDLVAGGASSTM